MRILMLSWEYPPYLVGGLGAHVAALVPALARQGVQVDVITPRFNGGQEFEALGEHAHIHRIDPPVPRLTNFFADVQQTNLALEEAAHRLWLSEGNGQAEAQYEIIHAHDWLVSFAAEALKRLHRAALVVTMHATERGRGRGRLPGEMSEAINGAEWWLTFEAWRVITTSGFMAQELGNFFKLPTDKITIIPNGVDTSEFDALEGIDLATFRARWALPNERIVFFIGRVQHEKGVHELIEAVPRVLARDPSVKFVIAGRGALLDALRQRAEDLGVAHRVAFAGYLSDYERDCLYKVADVAVFPSLYEPFGIVALEAMAAKCPVIVSDVGGLGEVVDNGITGIKITSDNLDALVNAMLNVLQYPSQARERAENGYAVVCHEFGWDLAARRTVALYERVIEERAATDW